MQSLDLLKHKTTQLLLKTKLNFDLNYQESLIFGVIVPATISIPITMLTHKLFTGENLTTSSMNLATVAGISVLSSIFVYAKSSYDKKHGNDKINEVSNAWHYNYTTLEDNLGNIVKVRNTKFAELVLLDELNSQYKNIIIPNDTKISSSNIKSLDDVLNIVHKNAAFQNIIVKDKNLINIPAYKNKVADCIFSNLDDIEKAEKLRSNILKFKEKNLINIDLDNQHTNLKLK